jgi:signal transduction histidine kinase
MSDAPYERYRELEAYVGWSADDARRVQALAPLVRPAFGPLVDDFYQEIDRHPQARKVITGGSVQVARLKETLTRWLDEMFTGPYDEAYVDRRWRVGLRHVQIGLDQVYTNAALSRLRRGLVAAVGAAWTGPTADLLAHLASLHLRLDLDLAIIEDAYQTEYRRRETSAQRLATIGKIAGGVAHELRNPLNVVKTSVYYLLHGRQLSEEKRRAHLERIERQVSHANDVITSLNDFARLPLPRLEQVLVADCLRSVVDTLNLPPTITVVWDLPQPEALVVLADRGQLAIVLSNLIRNACDAMPDGGTLHLIGRREGERVEIAIRDSGVGIPPEELPRILEPLYSTKAKGIGLGLSIAHEILSRHQGSLHVASQPGAGSTFTLRLPGA